MHIQKTIGFIILLTSLTSCFTPEKSVVDSLVRSFMAEGGVQYSSYLSTDVINGCDERLQIEGRTCVELLPEIIGDIASNSSESNPLFSPELLNTLSERMSPAGSALVRTITTATTFSELANMFSQLSSEDSGILEQVYSEQGSNSRFRFFPHRQFDFHDYKLIGHDVEANANLVEYKTTSNTSEDYEVKLEILCHYYTNVDAPELIRFRKFYMSPEGQLLATRDLLGNYGGLHNEQDDETLANLNAQGYEAPLVKLTGDSCRITKMDIVEL